MGVTDISIIQIKVTENIPARVGTGDEYGRELCQDLCKYKLSYSSGRSGEPLPRVSGFCTSYHLSLVGWKL